LAILVLITEEAGMTILSTKFTIFCFLVKNEKDVLLNHESDGKLVRAQQVTVQVDLKRCKRKIPEPISCSEICKSIRADPIVFFVYKCLNEQHWEKSKH
jgi:hypothetical protein